MKLAALALTVVLGVMLFAALGKDPVAALRVFFWEPIKSGYAPRNVAIYRRSGSVDRNQRDRDRAMRALAQSQSELVRRNSEVDAANRKLAAMSMTAGLTGIANRRLFDTSLEREWEQARASQQPLSLILLDVDLFKQYNDLHGHLVGDRVLQSVANILRSVSGAGDVACRLGGDEFALLIKATTRDEVMRIAEFVLTTAQGLQRMGHTPPLICSLSIGACLVGPEGDFNDWYASADAALYRAKRDGGNRVEWQDNRPMPA